MQLINNYSVYPDSKNRITLPKSRSKSKSKYYHAKEYDNGRPVLNPRELVKPKNISDKALKVMDESVANLKKGKVAAPVDLSDF